MAQGAGTPGDLWNAFVGQARISRQMGSPIYGELLERLAHDLAAGGPTARVVQGFSGHPVLDNLPLRLMGAVHGEVLAGRAPALARHYPSAGGRFEPEGAWSALRDLLATRREALQPGLAAPLQTNEVRRCCALLGGFLRVAAFHGLPLRVLEIGASGGLNLRFDRYAYALGPHRFEPADARLRLDAAWSGPPPAIDAPLRVAERAGCDLHPIDLQDPEQRLRLASFVWPDQPERLERLQRAFEAASQVAVSLERAPAATWLAERLAQASTGLATVVFQSVVWWYVSEAEREQITARMEEAGARAGTRAPLAWLRMEGVRREEAEIRIREWPGGQDRLLARAHWHGAWVAWEA
jgi:hypothetical protein